MADHAVSDHPAVQSQLDRLWSLSPGADILGLERITTLLERLGKEAPSRLTIKLQLRRALQSELAEARAETQRAVE